MEIAIDRVERAPVHGGNGQVDAKRVLISTADFASISPFLRFSEDWFQAPGGFDTHPHRGMQTVTLVLEGALHHRDHTGGEGVLRAGDVQWMTAGRGVLHSEKPWGTDPVHTLQLWLNLPSRLKMLPARYTDQPFSGVPVHRGPGVEVKVFAGRAGEVQHQHGSDWPLIFLDIQLDRGATYRAEVPASWRGFLYVGDGEGSAGSNEINVMAPDMAWFEPSSEAREAVANMTITASSSLRILLFAGPPIDEPVVAYGPFVMTTAEEIQRAFDDFRHNRLTDG